MRTERRNLALSSPLFIIAVALLLLNDFHLKSAFPGAITGKLSDVAGLFAFPFFFALFLPEKKLAIYIATAIGFLFWKLPLADGVISMVNSISPYSIGRVADYSDYWALLALPASYCYRPRPASWGGAPLRAGIALMACFAFCATSLAPGRIAAYRYSVPQDRLRVYVDSAFASAPELQIPSHLFADLGTPGYPQVPLFHRAYPSIDTTGYYFGCYINDEKGPETFVMTYSYDSDENTSGIDLVAAGFHNQMKTYRLLDDDEKDRLLAKFEQGFIATLGAYITPVSSDKD